MRIPGVALAAVAAGLALSCGDSTEPGPPAPAPRTDAVGIWDATISGLPGSDAGGQPATCTNAWIMAIETTDTGPGPITSTRMPYTASLRCGQDEPIRNGGIQVGHQFIVRQSGDTVAFLEPTTLDSFLVVRFTDSLTLTGRLAGAAAPGITFGATRRSDTADPNRAPHAFFGFQSAWGDLEVGDTMTVTPTIYDAYFELIPNPPVALSSGSPRVATIDAAGVLRGIAPGLSSIRGVIDTLVDGFTLTVLPPAASVEITSAPGVLAASDSSVLQAVARDANGGVLVFRRFYWTSSNPGVATVSRYGETADIRGVAPGTATITARSTLVSATVTVEVAP